MATSPPSGQASSARVSAARAASARRRRAAREGRATSSTSARRRSRRSAGLDTELPVDFWPTGLNLASAASAASAAARAALSGTRSALSASAAPLPTAGSPLPSAAVSSSDVINVDTDIASGPAADPSDGALTRDEITTIIGVDPTLPMSRGGMPPSEQRRRLARYRAIVASEAQLRRELSMSAQQVEAKIASAVATAAADPEKVAAEARRMTAAAVAAKEEEMRGQMQAMLLIQARALGLEDQLLHQLAEHRRLRGKLDIATMQAMTRALIQPAFGRVQERARNERARQAQAASAGSAAGSASAGSASSASTSSSVAQPAEAKSVSWDLPPAPAPAPAPASSTAAGGSGVPLAPPIRSTGASPAVSVRPVPIAPAPAPAPAADTSATPSGGLRGGSGAAPGAGVPPAASFRFMPPPVCRLVTCSNPARGGGGDAGAFCGDACFSIASAVAQASGGSISHSGACRPCAFPGCSVVAAPSSQFCSAAHAFDYEAIAAQFRRIDPAPGRGGPTQGSTDGGGGLMSGARPSIRSADADQSGVLSGGVCPPLGCDSVSVPIYNVTRRRSIPLGAEGGAGLPGAGGTMEHERRLWRQQSMSRAVNSLRAEQGLLGGKTLPRHTAASSFSLSGSGAAAPSKLDLLRPSGCSDAEWIAIRRELQPGTSGPAASHGDYNFDRTKIAFLKDNAWDECLLRAGPMVLMSADDEPHPRLREIVLDGVVPGQAAPVTMKDASGFLKVIQGGETAQFHRQIWSIKTLTMYVAKGVQTSLAKARDSKRRAASGFDVEVSLASMQHWSGWVTALHDFERSCMSQYVRVISPALNWADCWKANTLFWTTINLVLLQHHCTLLSGDGPAIFCSLWSAKMEKLAELANLDFYKVPARVKDVWRQEHENILRSRHSLPPVVKTRARKKTAEAKVAPSASDSGSPAVSRALTFDSVSAALSSGQLTLTAKQKARLAKACGFKSATPRAPNNPKDKNQGRKGERKNGERQRAKEAKSSDGNPASAAAKSGD